MLISPNNIVQSFFLLTLVRSGERLEELYPRQLLKFIQNNVWVQYLFLLFLIFFSLELIEQDNELEIENLYNSLVIFTGYIMFSKSSLFYSLLILFCLAVLFIILKLKENYPDSGSLDTLELIFGYLSLVILIVSFLNFIIIKKIEKGDKFNYYNLIFYNKHTEVK